eukprot:TRINITY_DN3269_c0_g1_i2.p1 TRINITY_DN3269_c0_g1~~TRINITY_DN3269_c0_g1_i2.p1  ORF type:complete len:146 (-),score=12.07 TRINITY_DN3269_c0_g1_i2:84-461(-)
MSNYGFHLPPSASAPALLSQGALQSITLLASFAPEAAVVLKLVAMGGQLCLHARWRHIDQQGPVFSLTSPSLTRPTPTQCHRCRRKIQVCPCAWAHNVAVQQTLYQDLCHAHAHFLLRHSYLEHV